MAALFSASIRHDINNLLSVISVSSQLLSSSVNILKDDKELADKIAATSKTLMNLMNRMMDVGKGNVSENNENGSVFYDKRERERARAFITENILETAQRDC